MLIVIDSNIVLAALMKPSKTQELIYSKKLKLISPEYSLREIKKYSSLIAEKSGKTKQQTGLSIKLVFLEINLIPKQKYAQYKEIVLQKISDEKDWPFLALALQQNCAIWSNDKHFKEQKETQVYTTKQLIQKITP